MPTGPEVKKKMDATEGLTDFMFLQPPQFLEQENTFMNVLKLFRSGRNVHTVDTEIEKFGLCGFLLEMLFVIQTRCLFEPVTKKLACLNLFLSL